METKERILECMNRALKIDNASEETSQLNCATWDSLNHLNLVVELETEFDIELEPEEISQIKSYSDIESMLSSKS